MLVCSLLRFFGPLLFPAVLFVNIAEAAVSNAPPEAGYYGSAGGGVKLGGQPDAAVQPNAGLVAGKSPLAPRGDARFVGIWTNSDKNFFLAMLGDGRAD
jgi:hypothetical protein